MTGHNGGPPLNDTYPTFVWRKPKKEELSYQEGFNKYRLHRELRSI